MKIIYNELECLNKLKHFLPSQLPLKDFVHHNTLHAFQEMDFFKAAHKSAFIFGTKTLLSLSEFHTRYRQGQISDKAIDSALLEIPWKERVHWKNEMFNQTDPEFWDTRIGQLRIRWKKDRKIDLDAIIWPKLVRLINAYLDQGIAFHPFHEAESGLLNAVKHIQRHSMVKIFQSNRVNDLLNQKEKSITQLLEIIVGNQKYFEQYLFDQQFSHPGISGMVCVIEEKSDSLFAHRPVSLFDLIYLELLYELEVLEKQCGVDFEPLAQNAEFPPANIFEPETPSEYWKVLELWQNAFELTYHDQVLSGIKNFTKKNKPETLSQAFFCMDDRSESIRRNIEFIYPECETFGTPGHFNLQAKFKPFGAKFSVQICPAGIKPTHLIKENNRSEQQKKDIHFQRRTHKFLSGLIISQTVGFWSSIKLVSNIFFPRETPAQYNARHDHMDFNANLNYQRVDSTPEEDLLVGYTMDEMVEIVSSQLTSVGLTTNFARLIYLFGHGGSSTNNPYFAGYNCGACSGRPGSLNARVFALMANEKGVREGLSLKEIYIPDQVHFIGGYHDTTQDTFTYFDEDQVPEPLKVLHTSNRLKFEKALQLNAKERARQFQMINITNSTNKIHQQIIRRSRALFEPRPEYNHSNNTIFVIGRRQLTRNLFLDERAFLNSYDYSNDPDGNLLRNILTAGTNVCGGINLEYFFSTTDNQKCGAGSKLPQNIFGLYGVANGVKGDLRPGLPWQMIDVHDPLRLLTVVEHNPEIVLRTINSNEELLQWYKNNWVKLAVYDPVTGEIFIYKNHQMQPYTPFTENIPNMQNLTQLIESSNSNLPVYYIN